ncbi:unnamed protein product [Lampetra fluviatilis]
MAVRKDALPLPEPTLTPSLAVSPEDLTDISFIGSGGFGIVFKATHKRWCVQVALKCAKSSGHLSQSHEADLLKEAQKMKMAQFDFILPLRGYVPGISSAQLNLAPVDLGLCSQILQSGGISSCAIKPEFSFRHALVMPYMPRGSLHGLLQRCGQASDTPGESSSLPWPLRCRFVDQIAHGMNYLHGLKPHPLLHLDLKPQNVLLDDDYHVKICDFGLSKWREVTGNVESPTYIESLCLNESHAKPHGQVKTGRDLELELWRETKSKWSDGESTKLFGTLPYVPPEYLRDTHRKPHYTFDVYSFAIVVWEILTLTTPYANAVNSLHVVECVVKENQRPSTDDIPEDRPREADSLIRLMTKCWDCNHKARPSFYECIKVTEPVFNSFKDNVLTARQELQAMLSQPDQEQLEWGELNMTTKIFRPVQETSKPPCSESSRKLTRSAPLDGATPEVAMDDALNVTVTNQDLPKIAELLGKKWKPVGRALGIREAQLENLEHNYHCYGMDEVTYQMLRSWREKEGRSATRATLMKVLKSSKVMTDDIFWQT